MFLKYHFDSTFDFAQCCTKIFQKDLNLNEKLEKNDLNLIILELKFDKEFHIALTKP